MNKQWIIAIDAGHGMYTAGKQSPDGEKEWYFNNQVVQAIKKELGKYDMINVLRVDDQSGKTDCSLASRVQMANRHQADLYISVHHNANTGKWGNWTGVETYIMTPKEKNPKSLQLAKHIHSEVVGAMRLKDRGIKAANFYVLRETKMPAILIEGGFMDSLIDIVKLRSEKYLYNQGKAIAKGILALISI
ncbi:N-acetylmuramoyl-L-alanine amidase family protein [Rummeliibacillus sp. JY-2-4R]